MFFAGIVTMVNTTGETQTYSGITAVIGMTIALACIASWLKEIT